jgi:sugar lactone lactonase YvrE
VVELGGGPNSAAIGPDGRCYVCNNGGFLFRRIGDRTYPDLVPDDYKGGWIEAVDLATGLSEVLYRSCGDIPLLGPNDIVFDQHGGFYFTDHGKVRARDRDRGAVLYAAIDGSFIKEIAFPVEGANGIGLSPDDRILYVAESTTARIWAYDIDGPGQIRRASGSVLWLRGRMVFASPHYAILDSLAVDGAGNIGVADIPYGGINLMSKEGLEGTAVFTNVWPTKKSGDLEARWKQRANLPWMTFDPAFGYGHVYVLKEALERAGSTDRSKIAEALHSMTIESGPTVAALNGAVSFDAKGARVNPPALLLQWQNGVPVVVYPSDVAVAAPLKATP